MVDYKSAGVDADKKEGSLHRLLEYVNRTFAFNACKPILPIGYYANVIDLSPAGFPVGIAFSTDGVGTKLLIAEMLNKFDTVGIDCIAMNVNDIICVGATPVSMVDYIAASEANARLLEEVAKGLHAGCEMAGINLCGGELAQVAELLAKKEKGVSFDIVGTAIGTVALDRIIVGADLQAGDVLIGLESSGLHSNGYTLARKALFDQAKYSVNDYLPELQQTVGEELLIPTRIYVKEVLKILQSVPVKALFHITGDSFFNLTRTSKAVGFVIDSLPEIPPIFRILEKTGGIVPEEMFRVFNMGIGFVIAVPDDSAHFETVRKIAAAAGYGAHRIGHVTADPERKVSIPAHHLIGSHGRFSRS